MNDKLTAFLRTKLSTFAGSSNPLDADLWLRVIQRKLEPFECQDRDKVLLAAHQLTGTALAWWENYCAAAEDATTITWKEFVKEALFGTKLFSEVPITSKRILLFYNIK